MRFLCAFIIGLCVTAAILSNFPVKARKSGDIIILGGWNHGWGHNIIKSSKKSEGDIIILGGWGGW